MITASRRAASGMWLLIRPIAASRTPASSLVNDSFSSPHAWPVPMAGTARPCPPTTRFNSIRVHQARIANRQLDPVVPPPGDLGDVRLEIALERHRVEAGGVGREHDGELRH